MRKKRAFTLAETLLAVTVLLLLCGGMMLIPADKDREAQARKAEAERLALWLTDRMTAAQAEGRGLRLSFSFWEPYNLQIQLSWLDGTGESETYKADKIKIWSAGGGSLLSTYDPEWHTVTPAFTLYVKIGGNTQETGIPITVSGQGYVRVGNLIKEKS